MSMLRSFDSTTVGIRVRTLRKTQYETQEKLAQKLCVSRELISKIETGRQFPAIEVLAGLSLHFQVSTDFIVFGASHESDDIQQLDQVIMILKSIKRDIAQY